MRLNEIEAAIDLGEIMHAESEFRRIPYDREKLRDLTASIIQDDDKFAAVCEKDGRLIGMFLGVECEFYFSRARGAFDWLWFVTPEERGTTAGLRLLKAFHDWAKARGCVEVRIGVSTGVDLDANHRIMERLGFQHMGGNWRLEV